jgi:hypothetical protein
MKVLGLVVNKQFSILDFHLFINVVPLGLNALCPMFLPYLDSVPEVRFWKLFKISIYSCYHLSVKEKLFLPTNLLRFENR